MHSLHYLLARCSWCYTSSVCLHSCIVALTDDFALTHNELLEQALGVVVATLLHRCLQFGDGNFTDKFAWHVAWLGCVNKAVQGSVFNSAVQMFIRAYECFDSLSILFIFFIFGHTELMVSEMQMSSLVGYIFADCISGWCLIKWFRWFSVFPHYFTTMSHIFLVSLFLSSSFCLQSVKNQNDQTWKMTWAASVGQLSIPPCLFWGSSLLSGQI